MKEYLLISRMNCVFALPWVSTFLNNLCISLDFPVFFKKGHTMQSEPGPTLRKRGPYEL